MKTLFGRLGETVRKAVVARDRISNETAAPPSKVTAHVRRAIGAAPLEHHPYPHLFVRNVLPTDFYEMLERDWPPSSELKTNFSDNIKVMNLSVKSFDTDARIPNPGNWNQFRHMMATVFVDALLEKLASESVPIARSLHSATLDERRPADIPFESASLLRLREFIVERHNHSQLSAHIDSLRYCFTVIFYFGGERSRSDWGTSIFKGRDGDRGQLPTEASLQVDAQFASHLGFECEKVAEMPFVPNSVLVLQNSCDTWHGQSFDGDGVRKSYNMFLGVRRDLLTAVMDEADAAYWDF